MYDLTVLVHVVQTDQNLSRDPSRQEDRQALVVRPFEESDHVEQVRTHDLEDRAVVLAVRTVVREVVQHLDAVSLVLRAL